MVGEGYVLNGVSGRRVRTKMILMPNVPRRPFDSSVVFLSTVLSFVRSACSCPFVRSSRSFVSFLLLFRSLRSFVFFVCLVRSSRSFFFFTRYVRSCFSFVSFVRLIRSFVSSVMKPSFPLAKQRGGLR